MPSTPDRRTWLTAAWMLAIFLVLTAAGARADPCRLVGCANQVFYIFLPDANLMPETHSVSDASGKHCKSPDNSQTFEHRGLPGVGEVATLRADSRWVYTEAQIEEEIELFQPLGADRGSTEDCSILWKAPDGGGSLDPGMKLRVLGYRTFVGRHTVESGSALGGLNQATTYPEQLLFAMVLVE